MLGPFCSLLSSLTWSIGSVRYTEISKGHSIYALNFTRALIALPLFVLATWVMAGSFSGGLAEFHTLQLHHFGWFTLSMISSYGLGDLCFFVSTRSLGVPTALAIASAYPIWSLASSLFLLGERISPTQGLGVVTVVVGIVWVILQVPVASSSAGSEGGGVERAALPMVGMKHQSRTTGVLLATLTSVFWALNSFAVARGGRDLSPTVGNSVRMILALLITSGLSLTFNRGGRLRLPMTVIRAHGWIFAVEAFGGSLFFLYGLSHSPLFLGTTLSALAPVLSVPIAVLSGLEQFQLRRFAAILLVLLGIFAILLPT